MPREANNQKQEDISPSPFTSPASEYNNPASLTTQTQKRKLSSSDKPEESHPSKRITRSQSAIQESSSSEKTPSPERPMRSRFLNPRMRPPTPPTLRREEKRVTWGVPDSPDQDAANVESPMRESETMRRCRDFNCKFVLYQGEYLCQGKCGEMSRKSMNALNLMSGSIEAHTNFIQQLETLALTLLENKSTRDDRRKYLWKAGNEIKNELPRHREELDKRVKTMQQLRSVCM
ncbi:MAG: hypothetical protein J3R72DRAFT_457212 [Linnemannia gamsii]|nr:MAG: hypothetical protein J3R72DRAFT_457212 [Linnemannia gamsii]